MRARTKALLVAAVILHAFAAFGGDGTIHRANQHVPGSYIVMLHRSDAVGSAAPELAGRHGGKLAGVFEHLNSFSIMLPNENAALAIARDPRVEWIEEDAIGHVADCPRPLPADGSQWSLARLSFPPPMTPNQTFYRTIGSSYWLVQVFVIDTAIETGYGDLAGKIPETQKVSTVTGLSYGVCPGSGGTEPGGPQIVANGVFDPLHGTAVASLIAGNNFGVVREIPNLYSVQAVDCQGAVTGTSLQAAANWVVSQHIVGRPAVANVSLRLDAPNNQQWFSAIQTMVQNGIFVSVAAGNEHKDACLSSPSGLGGTARYPGMLTVGATDIYGSQTSYSNYGDCVDVWAPGGATWDEYYANPYNRLVATGMGIKSGTSMAAPHVAGAAILIYAKYPTWSPADVGGQIKYLDAHLVSGLRHATVPVPTDCRVCDQLGCYVIAPY